MKREDLLTNFMKEEKSINEIKNFFKINFEWSDNSINKYWGGAIALRLFKQGSARGMYVLNIKYL
jgi:hypothetical protein